MDGWISCHLQLPPPRGRAANEGLRVVGYAVTRSSSGRIELSV